MKGILIFGLAVLCAAPAFAAKDDFNRSTLGKKWIIDTGTLSISNDQMVGSDNGLGYFRKSKADTYVQADVSLTNTDLQYGAVAIGDIHDGQNAFVKIQSSGGDSTFDFGAFYTGNNGSGNFFALTAPVPSPATLEVSLCGTVANMTIKSAAATQTYSYDYGSGGSEFGAGGGLGTYGPVALDNYKSKPGKNCTPSANAIVIKGHGLTDPTQAK